MNWKKKGVIWTPDKSDFWAQSHATCPTPIEINKDTTRIYLQSRDKKNVGRVGYIDVLTENPAIVISVSKVPVLDVGAPGTFDDSGVFQCSIVQPSPGTIFLYYAGFELLQKVRYRILTGLAISKDGGQSFKRYQSTPILERSDVEVHVRGGPSVIYHNNIFKMWYVAGSKWKVIDNKSVPVYSVKYLESKDGINWQDEGELVFDPQSDEHGFGRPSVYPDSSGGFEMLYSVRKRVGGYRMGYAKSDDGIDWERNDQLLNIGVSDEGPDSETIEFGAYMPGGNKKILLYNGNDFGRTGLLWAVRK
jgi:predicted GH43/DUF377 family glycosyl hydrolase